MFKKWFTKGKEETLFAPLQGKVIPVTEVPDPTFSEKMLGDGVAILPTEETVVSPINGKVVQLFPTKHAIGIHSKGGLDILIHVGLETVTMNGDGFTSYVETGDHVRIGDPLIRFSLKRVKEKAKSTVTPIVITNSSQLNSLKHFWSDHAIAGKDPILTVMIK